MRQLGRVGGRAGQAKHLQGLLLLHGLDPNEADSDGNTLIMALVGAHDTFGVDALVRAVRMLLDKGADPDLVDKHGQDAMYRACTPRADLHQLVELLLQRGAVPQKPTSIPPAELIKLKFRGETPTILTHVEAAEAHGQLQTAKVIREHLLSTAAGTDAL